MILDEILSVLRKQLTIFHPYLVGRAACHSCTAIAAQGPQMPEGSRCSEICSQICTMTSYNSLFLSACCCTNIKVVGYCLCQ